MPASLSTYIKRSLQPPAVIIRGEKGFTLLELIASLVLLGLLAAIFGMGLVAAMKSHEFNRTNTQLAQKAQLAMTRISRELMELTDIVAITGAGDDPFIIYRRVDPSISPPQPADLYGLHFDPATQNLLLYSGLNPSVTRLDGSTTGNGDVLISHVQNFSLAYFQGGGTWSWGSDFELLSSIEVNLNVIRPDRPSVTQNFSTVVHLRNTNNFGGAAPTHRPATRGDYSCFIHTTGAAP